MTSARRSARVRGGRGATGPSATCSRGDGPSARSTSTTAASAARSSCSDRVIIPDLLLHNSHFRPHPRHAGALWQRWEHGLHSNQAGEAYEVVRVVGEELRHAIDHHRGDDVGIMHLPATRWKLLQEGDELGGDARIV